jgi:hypothetical protein
LKNDKKLRRLITFLFSSRGINILNLIVDSQ